jgi:hypothetical protein
LASSADFGLRGIGHKRRSHSRIEIQSRLTRVDPAALVRMFEGCGTP